ncbi:ATP-binding cassette domain-containing protein [Hydromonas duriensis]|uniref:ATP-binding protein Uup n=1 Tax=Hydromonas duriensis TaxID=1527608 RepID=A0A4V3DK01_9BURK|nr:ATP-binding cassette domain-containing protein [Hydromonas duriensis]TDR32139.1 ATP-binding cassette subfamily F protein uup [Hydromonas duriensis]
MALFTLTDAQLAYGHVALLDHTEFSLEEGERVGLIGRNGTGKSSLLKIIAGTQSLDDGKISRQQGLRCAYVEQEPIFEPSMTVFQAVAEGVGEGAQKLIEYEQLTDELAHASDDKQMELLERLQEVQTELEHNDMWSLHTRVQTTLDQLGLDEHALCGKLSGGLQKRVALARALVQAPDILLLDEPTNHLDMTAIAWLEELLRNFKGAVLLITHDRAFLDNIATRIVELDRGLLRSYPGNFSAYQTLKAQQLADEAVENAKFDKVLAQEEIWIRKGVEARRTKGVARINRLMEMRQQHASRRDQLGQVKLDVAQGERSGKVVAELELVNKSFGDKTIVKDFTATIMRGDKVGFLAGNGMGKTTLLKLILGELAPDSGHLKTGTNISIAYFDQMRGALDPEKSLAETISPGSEWVEINGARKHVIGYLSDFLFAPQRANSPVKSLSGGERNRLLLARLFANPANVLVLDEPTNDLDIDTLELLEELLQDYAGTVFLVSHDRQFLDNVVTSVIAAEPRAGEWREYIGGFYDWQRQSGLKVPVGHAEVDAAMIKNGPKKTVEPVKAPDPAKSSKAKLSFKEQRELEELPIKIANLENEQNGINALLLDGQIFVNEPKRGVALTERLGEIDEELLQCLERWEALEARK